MYTIQFAQRSHFLSDDSAAKVLTAICEQKAFVTVPIDLAGDGGDEYIVTLNVLSIVALVQHREERQTLIDTASPNERARLSLVI